MNFLNRIKKKLICPYCDEEISLKKAIGSVNGVVECDNCRNFPFVHNQIAAVSIFIIYTILFVIVFIPFNNSYKFLLFFVLFILYSTGTVTIFSYVLKLKKEF